VTTMAAANMAAQIVHLETDDEIAPAMIAPIPQWRAHAAKC